MSIILKTVLTTALMVVLAMPAFAADLHVLNWKGYGTDEPWAVKAFEKSSGHRVINDFFNSEQEMLTKLRTNPGVYDVVMINAAFTGQAIENDLIQSVDTSKMANYADIPAQKSGSFMLNRDGKVFGVPWVWGVTSICVNDKSFKTLPTSIEVMWDEIYKGRVVIRDDAVEAIQFGALATKQDINDIKDMAAVKAKLTTLMPQIRTFWSAENDWNQMVATNQIDVGTYWSGSADRAKKKFKLPVSLVIPEEGAIGWMDAFSIPKGAKNIDGAQAFINYMIDPTFYVEWDNKVGAPVSANAKAVDVLPGDSFNRIVLANPKATARIKFQGPISDANREKYLAIWQEIKVTVK